MKLDQVRTEATEGIETQSQEVKVSQSTEVSLDKKSSFSNWFLHGAGGEPGYKRISLPWLLISIILGFGWQSIYKHPMSVIAQQVILPVGGIFVGLSFAWSGAVQSLVATRELRLAASKTPEGLNIFVGYFQFVCLLMFMLFGLLAVVASDSIHLSRFGAPVQNAGRTIVFAFFIYSLVESWHVVDAARRLMIIHSFLVGKVPPEEK
ncbi:MAG: hypothetical protein JST51_00325 [Armatimonadetes bacterium]|nr:hypothetical protein [Armatimonadota bacterium]